MDCNTCWTAVGAIGQCVCALATLGAVIVALRPYKRKIKIELESVIVKLNNKSQILPSTIYINNKGFVKETIVGIGIITKNDNFMLLEKQIEVESSGAKKVMIKPDDVWNALHLIDDKCFRIWVQNSAGYKYFSKRYLTKKYEKTSDVLDFSS